MRCTSLFCLQVFLLTLAVSSASLLQAQSSNSELVQISPPTTRRTAPPSATATVEDLEKRGGDFDFPAARQISSDVAGASREQKLFCGAPIGIGSRKSLAFGRFVSQ